MAITALPTAAIAALPTAASGPAGSPEDSSLLAGLPGEFAALLAQFTGNPSAATALSVTPMSLPPNETANDETESSELIATSTAGTDDLNNLIQNALPYLAPGLEKAFDKTVDRNKQADEDEPAMDYLAQLASPPPTTAEATPPASLSLTADQAALTEAAPLTADQATSTAASFLTTAQTTATAASPLTTAETTATAVSPLTETPATPTEPPFTAAQATPAAASPLTTDQATPTQSSTVAAAQAASPATPSLTAGQTTITAATRPLTLAATTAEERILPADDNPFAGLVMANSAMARHDTQPTPPTALPTGSTAGLPTGEGEALAGQSPAANIAADTVPGSPAGASFAPTLAAAQTSSAAAPAQPATTDIPTHLHERQWGQEFSEKIVWLAKADQQTAQININPPQLGPVQINLNISGDQASAVFTSPHAEVRQAIEDAMPRLRDMLSAAGISLGQANVGAQLPQQNKEAPWQFANGTRFSGETAILPGDGEASRGAAPIQRGRGLVDLFA